MLSKENRLNLKTSFRWVASGSSKTSSSFKFFYRLGQNEKPLIGVSIISAQFKKANLRNQAKRLMFDLAKKHLDELHKNLNLVIMPRSQVLELPVIKLEEEFENALSSLKIN